MLTGVYNRGSLPALESMVHFAAARQKVIANNIANVDTIGYKTLDLSTRDFEKALARAFEGQRRSVQGTWELQRTRSVGPLAGGIEARVRETRDAGILKHIENNVDLDIEMGKLVKNSSLHSFATTLLGQQFSMIRSAISERAMA